MQKFVVSPLGEGVILDEEEETDPYPTLPIFAWFLS